MHFLTFICKKGPRFVSHSRWHFATEAWLEVYQRRQVKQIIYLLLLQFFSRKSIANSDSEIPVPTPYHVEHCEIENLKRD